MVTISISEWFTDERILIRSFRKKDKCKISVCSFGHLDREKNDEREVIAQICIRNAKIEKAKDTAPFQNVNLITANVENDHSCLEYNSKNTNKKSWPMQKGKKIVIM